jgi:hypothetical protein
MFINCLPQDYIKQCQIAQIIKLGMLSRYGAFSISQRSAEEFITGKSGYGTVS